MVHTRTLKMTDDILSVRYSPNGKLLAVALLDSTVKVFYQDTLKFFISLYGHKVYSCRSEVMTTFSCAPRVIVACALHGHITRLEAYCDILR
jgi:U3 small nucleolar RNA-associated protein 12